MDHYPAHPPSPEPVGSIIHPVNLGRWFQNARCPVPAGCDPNLVLTGFEDDSRAVKPGGAFIAFRHEQVDGHRFIAQALEAGAALVLCEKAPENLNPTDRRKIGILPDTRRLLGPLAQAWWGCPSRAMKIFAVTGTNGKTTTAYLVEAIFQAAGCRPALFGTVEYRFADYHEPAPNTTPGALQMARFLARARVVGCDSASMEVSSHALVQNRVDGIEFSAALMTNLTQDHLDYHHTMEEYAQAKRLLFTRHRPQVALFNLDDPTARRFSREHQGLQVTYALDPYLGADLSPVHLELDIHGIRMNVSTPSGDLSLQSVLRGRFNASNLLGALAAGLALEIDPAAIVKGLEESKGAPGRFERLETNRPFSIFVDYAHTPDAVERILENVRAITPGRVIVVLGCGGDRDPAKRPLMGAAMGRLADHAIITTDNPRGEDPAEIAAAMEKGIRATARPGNYAICLDRRQAIHHALDMARPGDSIVIAGKGHESYQEARGVRHHFDDREVAREWLAAADRKFPAPPA